MSRRTLSTAADLAAGSLLLLATILLVAGGRGAAADTLAFLVKLTMPITGVLLIARGVAGAPRDPRPR